VVESAGDWSMGECSAWNVTDSVEERVRE
jgi:hypothetical protein